MFFESNKIITKWHNEEHENIINREDRNVGVAKMMYN